MGDYLYATAFSVLAELRDPYATTHLAGVCQELSRGEFLEVETRYNVSLSEAQYLQIIRDKTASLIAGCCHLGASVAGASPDVVERVTEFGWNYGMAFQVMDDCLDLIGEEEKVGKNLRADLDKGALSLPVIYLAASLSERERSKLFAPMKKRSVDQRFVHRIAEAAKRSGAIEQAQRTAGTFVARALAAVDDAGIAQQAAYRQLAQHAIERVQ